MGWWFQWWIALALLASGYSMARMGPAFKRSRFGYPIFCIGLIMAFLTPEELISSEEAAAESLKLTLSWAIPGAIGLYIVASGAPIYHESTTSRLIMGWGLTLYSTWIMFIAWSPNTDMIDDAAFSAFGVILAYIIYLYSIRVTESLGPGDSVTKPLQETEIKHVSEILLSNLKERGSN